MSDLEDLEVKLAHAIIRMPRWAQQRLLMALDSPPAKRAALIRELWSTIPGSSLSELLMDLEADAANMAVMRPMLREAVLRDASSS